MVADFTFRLALLLTPGILATVMWSRMVAGKPLSPFYFGVSSLIFGMAAYAVATPIIGAFNLITRAVVWGINALPRLSQDDTAWTPVETHFPGFLLSDGVNPSVEEILSALVVAMALGAGFAEAMNSNRLYKWARKVGLTRQTGYDGIWTSMHAGHEDFGWAAVHDVDVGRIYDGWVEQFSDSDTRDLLLRDVIVQDEDGTERTRIPALYVMLERGRHVVEFHTVKPTDSIHRFEDDEGQAEE